MTGGSTPPHAVTGTMIPPAPATEAITAQIEACMEDRVFQMTEQQQPAIHHAHHAQYQIADKTTLSLSKAGRSTTWLEGARAASAIMAVLDEGLLHLGEELLAEAGVTLMDLKGSLGDW